MLVTKFAGKITSRIPRYPLQLAKDVISSLANMPPTIKANDPLIESTGKVLISYWNLFTFMYIYFVRQFKWNMQSWRNAIWITASLHVSLAWIWTVTGKNCALRPRKFFQITFQSTLELSQEIIALFSCRFSYRACRNFKQENNDSRRRDGNYDSKLPFWRGRF